MVLAALFAKGGGGAVFAAPAAYLQGFITKKETSTVLALLCRATLCNWLVCLAIWATLAAGYGLRQDHRDGVVPARLRGLRLRAPRSPT